MLPLIRTSQYHKTKENFIKTTVFFVKTSFGRSAYICLPVKSHADVRKLYFYQSFPGTNTSLTAPLSHHDSIGIIPALFKRWLGRNNLAAVQKVFPTAGEVPIMRSVSRAETFIGLFLLATLAAIAAVMLILQSRYDPALFRALEVKGDVSSAQQTSAPPANPQLFAALSPEGLSTLGCEETFGPDTLSDKINGKAELYLSSGFTRLVTQRFSSKSNPKVRLELFVYDMGDPKNAFSVYSLQKRNDARKADVGTLAYSTGNALFFITGSKYIEIVSDATGLDTEMSAIARKLVQANPPQQNQSMEFALFPSELIDESTISLHMSDVFGFSRLNKVYTAKYNIDGEQVTAFISRRSSSEESAALASEYSRFLLENGGSDMGEVSGVPGSRLFQVFDTYETVLNIGAFFAGTHEVDKKNAAEEITVRIYRKLQAGVHEE